MIRSVIFVLAVAAGFSASTTHAQDRPFFDDYAYTEFVGRWVINCTNYARRLNGKMFPYNSCILQRVLEPGTLTGGNALIIIIADGFERIQQAEGDRFCDQQPRARLVDDIYISNLPIDRQIALLRQGEVYSEEFMPRKWPECWIVVRKAPLEGFERAYTRFLEVARERGALW